MKTYILEKREASFTDAELNKVYADNLFEIEGIPFEELERFSDKERALEVLRGFRSQSLILEGCRNKISKSEGSTSFVEYVIEECEVDEDGEFVSGSDYYTTPNWCDEYGFCYTANEGEDSATFNHSKMWYAMTETNESWEDLSNGFYDLATALRVAGNSDHYKWIFEINIPVLCGEECDWLCTDDFRAGEDF